MTIVIGSLVVVLTIVLGGLFAFVFSRLDQVVDANKMEMELEAKSYNPALTMGYEINSQAPADEQVEEARKQSAKQAAALPRGANVRIGCPLKSRAGKSASIGVVEHDPWTAAENC